MARARWLLRFVIFWDSNFYPGRERGNSAPVYPDQRATSDLQGSRRTPRFAAQEIRSSIELIAKLSMTLPDTPFINIHSTCLAPYYSATSMQALSVRLSQLVDAIGNAPAGDANARRVIGQYRGVGGRHV